MPTTIAVWLHAVLSALESRGVDVHQLAQQAGVEPYTGYSPMGRVPVVAMTRLWSLALEVTGDEAFALNMPEHFSTSYFQTFGVALVSSSTVREMLQRIATFHALVSDSVNVALSSCDGFTSLIITSGDVAVHHAAVEGFMSITLDGLARTSRPSVMPHETHLMRSQASSPLFEKRFGHVRYRMPDHRLVFRDDQLDVPLITANPSLAEHADRELQRAIEALRGDPLVTAVRLLLWQSLLEKQQMADITSLSGTLHVSERTLRRRLQQAGSGLAMLQQEARQRRALQLMEGDLSLGAVSDALGYHDMANFSTAFRRWFGKSPRDYRRQQAEPDEISETDAKK